MPLIFIHGVNVRNNAGYYESVDFRNALFRKFALKDLVADPAKVAIFNPYWGKHGVKFAWNQASLPGSSIEEMGGEDEMPILFLGSTQLDKISNSDTILLNIAQNSMAEVIDLLWGIGSSYVDESKADELAELAARAMNYVHNNPNPDWLEKVNNDRQFLRDLEQAVTNWQPLENFSSMEDEEEWEELGFSEVWDSIKEKASRLTDIGGKLMGRTLVEVCRPCLHSLFATFIGDVLVYLKERGTAQKPGLIVKEIIDNLEQAINLSNPEDDKLIVVAHSMGGNIIYDILTYFRPDIKVDILVTVGSQVSLFEEMKMFVSSNKEISIQSKNRVPKPPKVNYWLNLFDNNDVLSFVNESIFEDVQDFHYSTGKGIISAHMTYFTRPSFYKRLGLRIRELDR